jgi:hypothetical protein
MTELRYCVTIVLTMTERADQLHHDNAPAHSTALVQAFRLFWQSITLPRSVSPLQPIFGSLRLLAFPKAKIAVEKDKICECDSHTVRKLSQWCLTADRLAPWESDCSWMHSRSPLTGCQVTSRPRNRFLRYSKWLDTFQTALICKTVTQSTMSLILHLF